MKPNNLWKKLPFARICLFFTLGVLLQFVLKQWHILVAFFIVVALLFLALVFPQLPAKKRFRQSLLMGTSYMLVLSALGFTLAHFVYDQNRPGYFAENPVSGIRIRLLEPPARAGRYWKCMAEVQYRFSDTLEPVQGRLLVYLEDEKATEKLQYGEVVDVRSKVVEIEEARNPYQFDYKKYLYHKGIGYQCFVKCNQWTTTGKIQTNRVFLLGYKINKFLERRVRERLSSEQDQAILQALVLGKRNALDQQVISGFADAGVLHVLAVSGLHVGCVLVLLTWGMDIVRLPKQHLTRSVVALGGLWSFALITGFSPSVCRSALMFSIWTLGNQFGRTTNPYNNLLVAGFVLIVVDPRCLLDVGFQLSFSAVFGILFLTRKLRSLVRTSSWFMDKVYTLLAVSLAAQIVTFPLSVYYFNQFPVLFLPANLLVIPAMTMALYSGICLLLVPNLQWLIHPISFVVEAYLWFTRKVIGIIDLLSFSHLEVHFTFFEFAMAGLGVITICIVAHYKQARSIMVMLTVLAIFFGVQTKQRFGGQQQVELVFFDLGNRSVAGLRVGDTFSLFNASNLEPDDWQFNCVPYLRKYGVGSEMQGHIHSDDSVLSSVVVSDIRLSVLNKKKGRWIPLSDVLWVIDLNGVDLNTLISGFEGVIYADSRLTKKDVKQLQDWIDANGNTADLRSGFQSILLPSTH
ncbi:MAG: ComEC/Rec2 family competence protein [Bacteroidia bacterium]|nr:ComEC/Rec2 family competence protein [Bacteroidia bacterium]